MANTKVLKLKFKAQATQSSNLTGTKSNEGTHSKVKVLSGQALSNLMKGSFKVFTTSQKGVYVIEKE